MAEEAKQADFTYSQTRNNPDRRPSNISGRHVERIDPHRAEGYSSGIPSFPPCSHATSSHRHRSWLRDRYFLQPTGA